jgi:hypothetical protein
MWTGTTKEGLSGGTFAFSEHEREQAGFKTPCRFDPNRIVRFLPQQLEDGTVRSDPGRLSRKAMLRIEAEVTKRKPVAPVYTPRVW